ncbi:FAD-linked oxidase C-terminal domain-containing protein [Saccharomonospora sp. NPDC046836]|uniref:FAD-binding oxidoreductase n=1 Tax=Saccharomonospora sp. NPDC046836 TaxID=3156921 RepID=UPI0033E70081
MTRDLPARAVTAPELLAPRRADRSGATGEPDAIVIAQSTEEVQDVLRWAHARGVPVVPRGAGTGLAGGAVPVGGIVLDLSALNAIERIDPVDQIAEVQAGVVTADLDHAAAAYGLLYTPDPASAEISTIGGNIATNAGGMHCVKYGVTRDAVLGLDVVLADGRRIRTGRRTAKGVAGLDLTSLLVGSEGTLGVVIGATLRLLPRPERVATLAAMFPTVRAAADACVELTRRRVRPSLLELLDAATLGVIDRVQGGTLSHDGGALVIAQVDGPGSAAQIEAVEAAFTPAAVWVRTAGDPATAESLLAARRLALPSIEAEGKAVIEDICVPRSRLADAVVRIEGIAQDHGVGIYTFAHAGDGNLHPIITYDRESAEPPASVTAAAEEIFALALELGGTVTGEHGVGLLKREWLAREVGADVLELYRAVKQAFDPRAILNPGKGF